MNRDKQRLLDYLNHILESIARIERYVEGFDHVSFLQRADSGCSDPQYGNHWGSQPKCGAILP